jgi:2-dehydropantoate 2-reductase
VRYIIYGAGAVGGTIGARLFESGRDVVLIARGEHGRVMAAGGLKFGTPEGWRVLKIPVVDHPGKLTFTDDDVVVLALKSQDTHTALDALERCATPDLAIVCAQNGVENERRALRRFANVYGMCVMMAGVHLEPGIVHVHNTPQSGVCDVGRYPRGTDALATQVAADLEASSIKSEACADIMARKYAKLLTNLTNGLEAAVGRVALGSSLAERARAEASTVFAAAGIVATRATDSRWDGINVENVEGVERIGGSTMQSVVRGLPTLETDDLNGEIVLLGRLHGVPTPVNEMLQRLAIRMIVERIKPASLSLHKLEASV